MTQGYFDENVDLLENYSGRASSLWGLRSLSLAILLDDETVEELAMDSQFPIDKGDYNIELKHIGFSITGAKEKQEIIVFIAANKQNGQHPFYYRSWVRKVMERIVHRPLRIENFDAKYCNPSYSNQKLFYEYIKE